MKDKINKFERRPDLKLPFIAVAILYASVDQGHCLVPSLGMILSSGGCVILLWDNTSLHGSHSCGSQLQNSLAFICIGDGHSSLTRPTKDLFGPLDHWKVDSKNKK